MDSTDALESLSTLLTTLSESPYSLVLHARHLQLASLPELADQFEEAALLMTNFFAATDQVWLPLLQRKIKRLGVPDDFESSEEPLSINLDGINVENVMDMLGSFRDAENDYLCELLLYTLTEE
jgi:squamous cell carcinoma antigen recognized by T-cells 3